MIRLLKLRVHQRLAVGVSMLLSSLFVSTAQAALGELIFPAVTRSSTQRLASVHPDLVTAARETTLDNGTLVREFADAQGVVYAVRWDGPTLPDLHALLGRYFGTFARAAQSRHGARQPGAPLMVQDGEVVVQSRGRMRQFTGFAYVPALVPTHVVIDDVLR